MDSKLCPRCAWDSVYITEKSDGSEESRCAICGWSGPTCFGRLHDATNVKCIGGNDPTRWSEQDGHTRHRCSFFDKCQEAQLNTVRQNIEFKEPVLGMAASSPYPIVQQPRVLPVMPGAPGMPVMQQAPQPAMAFRPQQAVQPVQQAAPVQGMQPARPAAPAQGYPQGYPTYVGQTMQPYMVPPDLAPMPSYVPQNHVQPGAQVPSYLTVPEPHSGKLGPMFFNTIMRAAFKGMFHAAANLMDHFPWGG